MQQSPYIKTETPSDKKVSPQETTLKGRIKQFLSLYSFNLFVVLLGVYMDFIVSFELFSLRYLLPSLGLNRTLFSWLDTVFDLVNDGLLEILKNLVCVSDVRTSQLEGLAFALFGLSSTINLWLRMHVIPSINLMSIFSYFSNYADLSLTQIKALKSRDPQLWQKLIWVYLAFFAIAKLKILCYTVIEMTAFRRMDLLGNKISENKAQEAFFLRKQYENRGANIRRVSGLLLVLSLLFWARYAGFSRGPLTLTSLYYYNGSSSEFNWELHLGFLAFGAFFVGLWFAYLSHLQTYQLSFDHLKVKSLKSILLDFKRLWNHMRILVRNKIARLFGFKSGEKSQPSGLAFLILLGLNWPVFIASSFKTVHDLNYIRSVFVAETIRALYDPFNLYQAGIFQYTVTLSISVWVLLFEVLKRFKKSFLQENSDRSVIFDLVCYFTGVVLCAFYYLILEYYRPWSAILLGYIGLVRAFYLALNFYYRTIVLRLYLRSVLDKQYINFTSRAGLIFTFLALLLKRLFSPHIYLVVSVSLYLVICYYCVRQIRTLRNQTKNEPRLTFLAE